MYATNFVALPVQQVNVMQGMQPVLLQCADDGGQDGYWQQDGWASPQFMGCPIVWPAEASPMQAASPFAACAEAVGTMVAGVSATNHHSQEDATTPIGDAETAKRGRPRRRGRRSRRSQGGGAASTSPMEGSPQQGDMAATMPWDVFSQAPPTTMMSPVAPHLNQTVLVGSPAGIMSGPAGIMGSPAAGLSPLGDSPVEPPQVGVWMKRLACVSEEEIDDEAEQPASTRDNSVQSSDTADSPQGPEVQLGSLEDLLENQDKCSEIVTRLEASGRAEKKRIIEWLLPVAMQLALSRCGCRVVQKALEAQGSAGRNLLVAELEPNTVELYESLHGNHVLTKMIEMMPSAALRPIVDRLWEKGATSVARHRFGCRVFERLIEHCNETEIGALLDQIVADSEALCRHQYGNFVVQHLLEHGSALRRNAILARLLPDIPALAMHRTASHVVQRALDYSDEEGQAAIVNQLLWAANPGSLIEVAGSRYGSFVAEQLNTLKMPNNQGLSDEVARRFADNIAELGKSNFGNRVVECFGLEVPPTPGVEN